MINKNSNFTNSSLNIFFCMFSQILTVECTKLLQKVLFLKPFHCQCVYSSCWYQNLSYPSSIFKKTRNIIIELFYSFLCSLSSLEVTVLIVILQNGDIWIRLFIHIVKIHRCQEFWINLSLKLWEAKLLNHTRDNNF